MRDSDRRLAQEFKHRLQEQLGSRFLRLRAFGSRARGLCREDSDLDVMVVVDSADPEIRREIIYLGADLLLENPVPLSPFVVDPRRIALLERRERKIIQDIEREGVEI